MRTIAELLRRPELTPTAPFEPAEEFNEEAPTTEQPRRRKETLDERTAVFRVNR